jgi:N-acetylneuraminate epimerase
LSKGSDGKPSRTYLKEAWKFELSTERWTQLPDMPASTVAAPSPAAVIDGRQIIIFGGDDGTLAGFQPPDKHPGFRRRGLVFDLRSSVWTDGPELPVSRVTVPLVPQNDFLLLPSGEMRPGVRSPDVFELRIEANNSLK